MKATVNTAITVSIFSWPSLVDSPWYAEGCFYAALVLSISALIAVSQENVLLSDMRQSYASAIPSISDSCHEDPRHKPPDHFAALEGTISFLIVRQTKTTFSSKKSSAEDIVEGVQKSKGSALMMFLWQRPLMLMSYSWVLLVAGLTLHVLRPFILRRPFSDDSKVSSSPAP